MNKKDNRFCFLKNPLTHSLLFYTVGWPLITSALNIETCEKNPDHLDATTLRLLSPVLYADPVQKNYRPLWRVPQAFNKENLIKKLRNAFGLDDGNNKKQLDKFPKEFIPDISDLFNEAEGKRPVQKNTKLSRVIIKNPENGTLAISEEMKKWATVEETKVGDNVRPEKSWWKNKLSYNEREMPVSKMKVREAMLLKTTMDFLELQEFAQQQ